MKLTLKQQKFADYYIQLGNATEAAVKAGYSEKYAGQNADKLLKNTNVQMYIEKRNAELEDERIANMVEVKRFWTEMMRNMMVEPKDRLKASEFIAKTNGAFIDKVQHSGHVSADIEINIGEEDYET